MYIFYYLEALRKVCSKGLEKGFAKGFAKGFSKAPRRGFAKCFTKGFAKTGDHGALQSRSSLLQTNELRDEWLREDDERPLMRNEW